MKISIALVVFVASFVAANFVDDNVLTKAGFPACSVGCVEQVYSKSNCGTDVHCQCTSSIQEAVMRCVAASEVCKDATDAVQIRAARRTMCAAALAVERASAALTSSAAANSTTTAGTASTTNTRATTTANAPGSKPTSSSPPPKASAAPAAGVGHGLMGLLGVAAAAVAAGL